MEFADEPATPQGAFDALRPVCVRLTMEQTIENVKSLREQISSTDVEALQVLLDYVLFPLRFSLKTPGPKKPGLVQAILECISYLLSLTTLKSPSSLKELFDDVCACLPTDQDASVPEELKMAVISTIQALLQASGEEVLPILYKPSAVPEMGFAISLLLKLAEVEKARDIRLGAMKCLEKLMIPEFKQDISLGDLFASFLPGMCTVMAKVICADPKQGYRVTTTALKLWANAVICVMSDDSIQKVPDKKPEYPGLSARVQELLMHRDHTWVKYTGNRLVIHLKNIIARCTADPHWKVRMALVDLAQQLLSTCWFSFDVAVAGLLRVLIGHMSDEKPEIKKKAREAIMEIEKRRRNSKLLPDVLSDGLHSLAVSLPRLLTGQDDQGKLTMLLLLIGFLQMLGPRLTFTLHSPIHLQRLSAALMQTLELDLSSKKVVEERLPPCAVTSKALRNERTGAFQKTFRFFRDQRILCHIGLACRLLGYYGDIHLLVDHFLGLYRAQKLPSLLVINQLVLGAAGIEVETLVDDGLSMDADELLEVVRPLLEEFTDPSNWHLRTCQDTDDMADEMSSQQSDPVIDEMSANAWKLCLQLEAFSCFAQSLGKHFRPLLMSTLYPLLEKAGEPSLFVSGTAMEALVDVSQACGYKNISQLIELNADYLASEISVSLRHIQKHHGGPIRVLQAMLENCNPTLLPLLYELVQDLLPALDHCQNEGAMTLLSVLNSLVIRLAMWFPPPLVLPEQSLVYVPGGTQGLNSCTAQEMMKFLQDHMKQCKIATGEIEEEESSDPLSQPDETKDEEKTALPIHVKIGQEVAEKCTHFLSHANPRIRAEALDNLRLCLLLVKAHEDVLLPLAHKMWPCLVKRLVQDEPLILMRAFQVLATLSSTCREFLRPRVCKDALPAFLAALRAQAHVSLHAGSLYHHTAGYKLQRALLEGLGTLSVKLSLGDSDLMEVVDSCMLYLSSRQPKKLQDAAVREMHKEAMTPAKTRNGGSGVQSLRYMLLWRRSVH
ncbi:TELO2-interacting protein 1 homolog isoform X2 [Hyperolius riggenbachi]|uniref:TELO2-interacting protein 1 homolog isoform X2 n=1 Tax=Hyperolius riggenbachi TaxID=752182 RepID=UPI0035A2AF97